MGRAQEQAMIRTCPGWWRTITVSLSWTLCLIWCLVLTCCNEMMVPDAWSNTPKIDLAP
jgi:hypothetical protein